MNWEFIIGDVIVPIVIFIGGFFTGKTVEKKMRNKANVKGDGNTVIQGSNVKNQ